MGPLFVTYNYRYSDISESELAYLPASVVTVSAPSYWGSLLSALLPGSECYDGSPTPTPPTHTLPASGRSST